MSGRKGFLGEFVDNLRQEFNKNQEMKENIKKFREEAKKLEESDALQQARKKYVTTFVFNFFKKLLLQFSGSGSNYFAFAFSLENY